MLKVYALKLNLNREIGHRIVDDLLSRVEPTKEVRLRRFVRQEDKLRGLFADLLIRDLIMQRTGLKNEEIEFFTNQYGKPFLKGMDDVQFNLSHSGNWVVAVIDDQKVGIDIEQIQSIDLDIAKHYFSESEHKDLMRHGDRLAYFFTLWSLKESYIKILGEGLSHPLNAFSICFKEDGEIMIYVEGKQLDNIFFTQYDVDPGYKMGICACHGNLPKHVNIVTQDQLIRKFTETEQNRQYWYSGQDIPRSGNIYIKNLNTRSN